MSGIVVVLKKINAMMAVCLILTCDEFVVLGHFLKTHTILA